MNLLTDAWIPVIRKNGEMCVISPLSLLDDPDTNPVVRVATTRPDFDGALLQFLIGLYQVLLSPEDEDEWKDLLEHPPARGSLNGKIDLFSPAFVFDEGDHRFMQDGLVQDTDEREIANLVLEINNTLFLKENSIRHMCPTCAGMALLTMQLNATSGGRGHMTSLRGGGPLTTILCLPDGKATLWTTILLNILPQEDFPTREELGVTNETLHSIFPWVCEIPNSENGSSVLPGDMHPYHVYWNVPRRIYIDFSEKTSGVCDICGSGSERLVSRYWSRPNGIRYPSESWSHPLSPYYQEKKGNKLPVHAHESDLTYANWMGIVMRSNDGGKIPAAVIRVTPSRVVGDDAYADLKIHVFGYVTDKAKVQAWQEGVLPTVLVSETIQESFFAEIATLIDVSSYIANGLVLKVKAGFTSRPGELAKDLSGVRASFWQDSESAFYTALHALPEVLMQEEGASSSLVNLKMDWLTDVRNVCLSIFKDWVSFPAYGEMDPALAAKAEIHLRYELSPNNPKLCELLGLPVP